MLDAFSFTFVADTKIIFRYDFVAPLSYLKLSPKILLITFKCYLGNRLQRTYVNNFSLWPFPVFQKDLCLAPNV